MASAAAGHGAGGGGGDTGGGDIDSYKATVSVARVVVPDGPGSTASEAEDAAVASGRPLLPWKWENLASSVPADGECPPSTFKVMQWNVLASSLDTTESFPRADPAILGWSPYRAAMVRRQIRLVDPDILCMEEVNFLGDILPAGYNAVWRRKDPAPASPPDGIVIAWKTSKFRPVEDGLHTLQYMDCSHKMAKQVAAVVVLEEASDATPGGTRRRVAVAATHLKAKAKPEFEALRRVEIHQLTAELNRIRGPSTAGGVRIPCILCGDFNSPPEESTYTETLRQCPDLRSVYGPGGALTEPPFTTWKFREKVSKRTIDYMFHSPELQPVSRLALPSEEEIGADALPCASFGSDHLCLGSELRFM